MDSISPKVNLGKQIKDAGASDGYSYFIKGLNEKN